MHVRSFGLVLATALLLSGCATGIPDLNRQPNKFYQETVTITGRVSRMQEVEGQVLIELADAQEHRVLVVAAAAGDAAPDAWVKVTGIMVPELRVGGKLVYDVIQAESVSSTGAPWMRDLF